MARLVRRNPTTFKTRSDVTPLPLAARVLMRRFGLMPGMAVAVAAAAGFDLEVR